MAWLQSLDTGLLRFINLQLQHPVLDEVMKFLSGNAFFVPALVLLGALLIWKGGVRGRVFLVVLALVLLAGDTLVIAMLKRAIARPRPFVDIPDLHVMVGRSNGLGSMPSGHASIWFAATLMAFVYYRRSWRFLLPLACAVSFSRLYLGVHYPSDVLVAAALGAGYAVAGLVLLDAIWQRVGKVWFPLWWAEFPSLLHPGAELSPEKLAAVNSRAATYDRHWLRLGYVVIALVLLGRLAFLAGDAIELSKDEAYQWLWSKHLALSYYSKPPLIACAQWFGTAIWGDTAFGVRFLSPVIGAVLAWLVLRFMARVANAWIGFWLVLMLLATPLLAIGSTLLTIDPLLVLFWMLAVVVGWRAVQPDGTVWHWLGVGLSMGLAFLSKYSALYLLVCWTIFFVWCRPARAQLRRAGPYLALGVNLLCTLPVILWNAQHSWITLDHVSERSGLQQAWRPTLRFFLEFLAAQWGVLNPVFFAAAVGAIVWFLRGRPGRGGQAGNPPRLDRPALMIYLFCMGPTVFLGHLLYSFYARVQANWAAPAVVPMFCLMALYWERRWRAGARWDRAWLATGFAIGFAVLAWMHEPKILEKLVSRPLPPDLDPLRRVRAWSETAQVVEAERKRLGAEGKPAFVIAHHYGLTGLLAFYTPAAQAAAGTNPEVYYVTSREPRNQLYFWPHYRYREHRKGQHAIYVVEVLPRSAVGAWVRSTLTGSPQPEPAAPQDPPKLPPELTAEFASVTDLGLHPVQLRGRVYRWLHLYACRDLH